jgi:uncharacterized phage protein (TIGR02216 family)
LKGAAAASFPWDDVTAFCLGRLRWSPEQFWGATPRELACAIRGFHGISEARAPNLQDLETMMLRFPDA